MTRTNSNLLPPRVYQQGPLGNRLMERFYKTHLELQAVALNFNATEEKVLTRKTKQKKVPSCCSFRAAAMNLCWSYTRTQRKYPQAGQQQCIFRQKTRFKCVHVEASRRLILHYRFFMQNSGYRHRSVPVNIKVPKQRLSYKFLEK